MRTRTKTKPAAAAKTPGYTPAPAREGNGPAYDVFSIPDRTDGSKYDLPVTEAGWPAKPGMVLASNTAQMVARLRQQQPGIPPRTVEVNLQVVRRTRTGYVLRDRGTVSGPQTHASTRPGQRWRQMESSTQGFDSFVSGGEAFEKMPDAEAFECLRATCERHQLEGHALRMVNDAFAQAICVRAGILVTTSDLPDRPGNR